MMSAWLENKRVEIYSWRALASRLLRSFLQTDKATFLPSSFPLPRPAQKPQVRHVIEWLCQTGLLDLLTLRQYETEAILADGR